MTSTPIKDIRKGLSINKIEAELDKTFTSTIIGSDSDTTLNDCSDGDGFDATSENSATADSPEPFYEEKGKDPLIRKGNANIVMRFL